MKKHTTIEIERALLKIEGGLSELRSLIKLIGYKNFEKPKSENANQLELDVDIEDEDLDRELRELGIYD